MIEIRYHGRGGQGAVTSAELVANTAINEGKYAQAFPSFGPERRGAPVMAFTRVSEKPIRTREKVYNPNVVVVLDPTLLSIVDVQAGLQEGGVTVINTNEDGKHLREKYGLKGKLALVDASKIAIEELKVPITNTTMLGALVKATAVVGVAALEGPLEKRFGGLASKNIASCGRAFEETIIEE